MQQSENNLNMTALLMEQKEVEMVWTPGEDGGR
jgi:hypothetical protein